MDPDSRIQRMAMLVLACDNKMLTQGQRDQAWNLLVQIAKQEIIKLAPT